jgi:hypothetical protein
MRNKNQRGEAFALFLILMMSLATGAAVSMKVHDPNDELSWSPEYENQENDLMDEEDHILAQMKGPEYGK